MTQGNVIASECEAIPYKNLGSKKISVSSVVKGEK